MNEWRAYDTLMPIVALLERATPAQISAFAQLPERAIASAAENGAA